MFSHIYLYSCVTSVRSCFYILRKRSPTDKHKITHQILEIRCFLQINIAQNMSRYTTMQDDEHPSIQKPCWCPRWFRPTRTCFINPGTLSWTKETVMCHSEKNTKNIHLLKQFSIAPSLKMTIMLSWFIQPVVFTPYHPSAWFTSPQKSSSSCRFLFTWSSQSDGFSSSLPFTCHFPWHFPMLFPFFHQMWMTSTRSTPPSDRGTWSGHTRCAKWARRWM